MSSEPGRVEREIVIEVPAGYTAEARLDIYLTRAIANATRSKVQRGIRDGRVTVNDVVVTKSSHPVQAGDRIVCRVLRSPPIEAAPEAIPLDIVHEDDWLIVVNKPAGMVVHPAYGNRTGTLVNALLYHVGGSTVAVSDIEDTDEDTGLSMINAMPGQEGDPSIRPGIVHRLDKDTSGLLVVAKDDATHAKLARQFAERSIDRDYMAIVWGVPDPPTGIVDAAIGRDPRDRKKMAVVPDDRGKPARTRFELLTSFADVSLVRFRLETGRTHQIRVHAAHRGHPVFGDHTYGGADPKRFAGTKNRRAFYRNVLSAVGRQALHARSIGFEHPATGERVFYDVELPDDMSSAIERLKADSEA